MIGKIKNDTELKNSILSILNRNDEDEYGYLIDGIGLIEILRDYYGSKYIIDTLTPLDENESDIESVFKNINY